MDLVSSRLVSSSLAGFSLVEMMVAVVVLGLGMIMVASFFPVGWTRARQLSEFTNQAAVVESAHNVVKSLVEVDGKNRFGSSFAGDLFFELDPHGFLPGIPGFLFNYSDTRVHALHLENRLVQLPPGGKRIIGEEPFNRESIRFYPDIPPEVTPLSKSDITGMFSGFPPGSFPGYPDALGRLYTNPQVSFEQRVYPPLRRRLTDDFTQPDQAWDEMLDNRRYAWAVLHRLRERLGLEEIRLWHYQQPYAAQNAALEIADARRVFDMYYVTLRRPVPTYRYAQQDPNAVPDTEFLPKEIVIPKALPPEEDVTIPVPWRVQIDLLFPKEDVSELTNRIKKRNSLNPDEAPTGVPAEVLVNPEGNKDYEFVIDMFPVGADFIDERSGVVYKVADRRLIFPPGGDDGVPAAVLILDRELLFEDVNEPQYINACDLCDVNTIDTPWEALRTVWVFPPAVKAARGPRDVPIFEGVDPVVGIDVRTLTLAPGQ